VAVPTSENHRLLLYGASNLWLSRRAALTELRKRFPGYLQIGLALGPGRSYGLTAGNPLFRYEPLHQVDFDFEDDVRGDKIAIITDIGNDIAYSQPPQKIVEWVGALATRLQEDNYSVIVGGIPTRSLALLDPRIFQAFAKLYYSEGSVSHQLVTRNLEEVEIGVRDLCLSRDLTFVDLESAWYSYDRFHLKRRARSTYWQALLQSYPERQRFDSRWSLSVRRPLFPKKYWLVGKERRGTHQYRDLVPQSVTKVR
jgi:hypothetical protein